MKKLSAILLIIILSAGYIMAGPPFDTDDPEPVGFMHWEFYVSSAMEFMNNNRNLTLPHFEVNYGPLPNMQLHVLAPFGYVKSGPVKNYGYMDTELGVKYRFINTSGGFMAGVFPLVEIPTGNSNKMLGSGKIQVYIPLWLQQDIGKFTTYGGAGYWFNPGPGNKNWTFVGWEGQYDLSDFLTLGGEIFYHTADSQDGSQETGFHLGGIINFNDHNHLLFSIGRSLNTPGITSGYFGYQITI